MGTHHHLVGYARVSTLDQNPELQLDALRKAGCKKVFVEAISSAKDVRPQLAAALEYLRVLAIPSSSGSSIAWLAQ